MGSGAPGMGPIPACARGPGHEQIGQGDVGPEPRHQSVTAIAPGSTTSLAVDADDVQGELAQGNCKPVRIARALVQDRLRFSAVTSFCQCPTPNRRTPRLGLIPPRIEVKADAIRPLDGNAIVPAAVRDTPKASGGEIEVCVGQAAPTMVLALVSVPLRPGLHASGYSSFGFCHARILFKTTLK